MDAIKARARHLINKHTPERTQHVGQHLPFEISNLMREQTTSSAGLENYVGGPARRGLRTDAARPPLRETQHSQGGTAHLEVQDELKYSHRHPARSPESGRRGQGRAQHGSHVPDSHFEGFPLTGGASPRTPTAPHRSRAGGKEQQQHQPASEPPRWDAGAKCRDGGEDSPLRAGLHQLPGVQVQRRPAQRQLQMGAHEQGERSLRRSHSDPMLAAAHGAPEAAAGGQRHGGAARSLTKKELEAVLLSYDELGLASAAVASARRWWADQTGAMAKKADAARDQDPGSAPVDVGALRSQLAKAEQSLEKQRREHAATRNRAQALEHQCSSLEQSQRMMTERLAAAEEQLALSRHDALAAQLADAKLTLAQSEFHVLQLQGDLKNEKAACSVLRAELAALKRH